MLSRLLAFWGTISVVAWLQSPKMRAALGLVATLTTLYFVSNRLLTLVPLTLAWIALFFPFTASELIAFLLAALFFFAQNYVCLKAGLFEFKFQDILLMPYYEPPLWGFYFLSMKRFISGFSKDNVVIDWKSVAGLTATSLVFSVFSYDSHTLFIATAGSTAFLLLLFHTTLDAYAALYMLALGLVVELFGVSTGLWSYPAPDFLGIPYWFATMWISVGLLGRRFLFPAAEWLATRTGGQRA